MMDRDINRKIDACFDVIVEINPTLLLLLKCPQYAQRKIHGVLKFAAMQSFQREIEYLAGIYSDVGVPSHVTELE